MKFSLSAIVAAAFMACASMAAANDFETPVTPEFYDGEVRFTGEFGTVYVFRWYPMNIDGRFAICGIGFFRDAGFRSTVRGMAQDASFYVNGTPYPVDISHFTRVNRRNLLQSGAATCRQTDIPVAGTRRVAVQFGRGTYRN